MTETTMSPVTRAQPLARAKRGRLACRLPTSDAAGRAVDCGNPAAGRAAGPS